MSTTGQILRQARGDTPLRDLADKSQGRFSKSTLGDLELDRRSVRPDEVQVLAKLYNVPVDVLQQETDRESWRKSFRPEPAEPFLNLLSHAERGDHIVVVAQRSIVPDNTEIPKKLVDLAADGIAITYVAGVLPSEGTDDRWQSNHRQGARLIYQEARTSGRQECVRNIHYLLITAPSPSDFAFLRAYDAAIYFRKDTESLEDSCVWVEVEIEPGKCWWTPAGHRFQADLDYWLVQECGLLLPTMKFEAKKKPSQRSTSFQGLVEFLGHDSNESGRSSGPAKDRTK